MISLIAIFFFCAVLLYIGFVFKGKMDWSGANKFEGEERYKNRDESWKEKYYQDSEGKLQDYTPKWYYLAFDFKLFGKHFKFDGIERPLYREKFMWSSTVFVFLTDYWHRTQFYFLNSLTIVLSILVGVIGYIVNEFWIYFSVTFIVVELVYWLGFKTGYRDVKSR